MKRDWQAYISDRYDNELGAVASQASSPSLLRLEQSNVGSLKRYAKAYRRFRAIIEFDTECLDEIYGSRYARHFYSAQQLEGFRARWRGARGRRRG